MDFPRPFDPREKEMSLQRTDGGLAKAVVFSARKNHVGTSSFDTDVHFLEDNKHSPMAVNHEKVNSLDYSNLQEESRLVNHNDVISCGDSN